MRIRPDFAAPNIWVIKYEIQLETAKCKLIISSFLFIY